VSRLVADCYLRCNFGGHSEGSCTDVIYVYILYIHYILFVGVDLCVSYCISGESNLFFLNMEKLTAEQQSHIKKMNEVRLITKLTQVGVPGEKLETMDRQAMMNMWAEFVASGKDKPVTGPVVFNPVGYDPEIEKKD
jgi:hypothetical protein